MTSRLIDGPGCRILTSIVLLGVGVITGWFTQSNAGEKLLPDKNNNIEFIESQTGIEPAYSVIWLHGLGADGHDFESMPAQLGLSKDKAVRFIFPHAPMRAITINGGMVMRGWYDITGMEFVHQEDAAGMNESKKIVETLIQQENQRGIATANIVLAGFSQGGAIALHTGLRYPEKLAGILALSTYLPLSETVAEELSDANGKTPVLYAHGTYDPVIPLLLAEASRQKLQDLNVPVEWKTYPIQHSVAPEEIEHIAEWLNRVLPD